MGFQFKRAGLLASAAQVVERKDASGADDLAQVIEKLGVAFEEFKKTNDQQLVEIKKGMADAVTADKLRKINEDLTKLSDQKSEMEKGLQAQIDDLAKKANRPSLSGDAADAEIKALASFNAEAKSFAGMYSRPAPADVTAEEFKAYRAGFKKFLRQGKDMLEPQERKDMTVGTDPDGGYLVTPDVSGRIVTRVFDTSPIRQIASVQTIGTEALEGIRDTDEAASGGWVGEQDTRSKTTNPQIFKWRIPVHEIYAQPAATQQLLDDANVNVEAWLAAKVADKLTRVENAAFVTGDGVGKPRGLGSYPTAATADATRPWGTFEHIASGQAGDFPASNPGDKLFDLIMALKQAYLQNARWLSKREVIAKIRKFKEATTNAYMWQPGLAKGQPDSLLGYPITMAEDLAALASGSLSTAFGDFAQGYQIVDRQGFRVIRDNLTQKPFVLFYTTRRVGADVVQFECIKWLKFS